MHTIIYQGSWLSVHCRVQTKALESQCEQPQLSWTKTDKSFHGMILLHIQKKNTKELERWFFASFFMLTRVFAWTIREQVQDSLWMTRYCSGSMTSTHQIITKSTWTACMTSCHFIPFVYRQRNMAIAVEECQTCTRNRLPSENGLFFANADHDVFWLDAHAIKDWKFGLNFSNSKIFLWKWFKMFCQNWFKVLFLFPSLSRQPVGELLGWARGFVWRNLILINGGYGNSFSASHREDFQRFEPWVSAQCKFAIVGSVEIEKKTLV